MNKLNSSFAKYTVYALANTTMIAPLPIMYAGIMYEGSTGSVLAPYYKVGFTSNLEKTKLRWDTYHMGTSSIVEFVEVENPREIKRRIQQLLGDTQYAPDLHLCTYASLTRAFRICRDELDGKRYLRLR